MKKELSRRDFLRGAAAGTVSLAAAGLLAGCAAEEKPEDSQATPEAKQTGFRFADTIQWNAEYDVVVIGYGGAGAVASLAAVQEGASVLMIEKAPRGLEGGNTRLSCNFMASTTDPQKYVEQTIKKNNYLFTDTCDEETMYACAEAMSTNLDWLESIGATIETRETERGISRSIGKVDAYGNVVSTGIRSDKKYWQTLVYAVQRQLGKGLEVWYACPAQELIQDPYTKTILGVQAKRNGEVINIRAKNGVVMALGGFEWNKQLQQNFLNRPYIYPYGSKYNTGDGVYMAEKVGAQLWHMSNLSGPDLAIYNPFLDMAYYLDKDTDAKGRNRDQRVNQLTGDSTIVVGPNGARFMSESSKMSHGRLNIAGEKLLINPPNPCYAIFDEKCRLAKKFVPQFEHDDNSDILVEGWAVQADTIEELAEKMGMENLVQEVADYNAFAKAGLDAKFGRDPEQMEPMEQGPFYAIKLVPAVYNTQGGARRNKNAEVLDMDNNPIPHLYSAGEFGAIWPAYYGGGMNIAETCAFGRIAGKSAAQPKEELEPVVLPQVASAIDNAAYAEAPIKDFECGENEYLGESFGISNPIIVKVKYVDGVILDVKVVYNMETPGIADKSLKKLADIIVQNNNADYETLDTVDALTGATVTKWGICHAVQDAIAKAQK